MPTITALSEDRIQALKDLDSQEPYVSMDIDAALVAYNTESIVIYEPVNSSSLNKWAAVNQTRKPIFQAAEDYDHPAYELAAAARFSMIDTQDDLDLNDTEVQILLHGLVSLGVIPQEAVDDLLARAQKMVSPAHTLGIPKVRRAHLEQARGI